MKLSIIIPTFNEAKTIKEVIDRVKGVKIEKELIVVDDGSQDGTKEILKGIDDIKAIYHERNLGKGRAIRTGLEYATGELVIIQDGDLEYNPSDYYRLIKEMVDKKAEVVYGVRPVRRDNMRYLQYIGNKVLTYLTNILYKSRLQDVETCYKMFRLQVIKGMALKSTGFEFEVEVTSRILKKGIRIYEIPISYKGRNRKEGKKIGWKDGLISVWTLIKHRIIT